MVDDVGEMDRQDVRDEPTAEAGDLAAPALAEVTAGLEREIEVLEQTRADVRSLQTDPL